MIKVLFCVSLFIWGLAFVYVFHWPMWAGFIVFDVCLIVGMVSFAIDKPVQKHLEYRRLKKRLKEDIKEFERQ